MIKKSTNLTFSEVQKAVHRLPMKKKLELFRELQKETWDKQLKDITREATANRKKLNISLKDVRKEIEKARQEFYERRNRH